ncbi:hypothetical protein [Sphingomicrobium marinum]|uniref:hypothetical protein n=1 Tax=Sphingomicrobium marinum TaxID=1227950 RepID=UPI0022408F8E|nr:hypothetical protein [Sphingomicrobium marinum]
MSLISAPAAAQNGKGNGKGNGGGGSEPPAAFEPAIGYRYEGRGFTDIRLANRAGDQACTVLRFEDGGPRLRGFGLDAANMRLAYGLGNDAIYLATLTYVGENPCPVALEEDTELIGPTSSNSFDFIDFSPDGALATWTESDEDYTGLGSSGIIAIYDLETGETTHLTLEQWHNEPRPEWGTNGEWAVGSIRFSPDFAATNEIIFSGAPLNGYQGAYNSIWAYNINEMAAPRKIYDGAGIWIDAIVTVTNPQGMGEHRVAFTDNDTGNMLQVRVSDGVPVETFPASEPAYSCDNSELIHNGGRRKIYITSADGTSSQRWGGSGMRFFDWFCPGTAP